MNTIKRVLIAPAALAAAVGLGLAAPMTAHAATVATPAATANPITCPPASSFQIVAPAHTEVGGNIMNKSITFGGYWQGGTFLAPTWVTLNAGTATVTLSNGRTYTAPVVAGGTSGGVFPTGGAALDPMFTLQNSSAFSPGGRTDSYHVTSISYPVTLTGDFGTCSYTVKGTATSQVNVTSITVS